MSDSGVSPSEEVEVSSKRKGEIVTSYDSNFIKFAILREDALINHAGKNVSIKHCQQCSDNRQVIFHSLFIASCSYFFEFTYSQQIFHTFKLCISTSAIPVLFEFFQLLFFEEDNLSKLFSEFYQKKTKDDQYGYL